MCGVFAYFDPSGAPQPPFCIEPILAALGRRGPDGRGLAHFPGCSLVHTRLAILDRARGQQPMRHVQTGLTISYNGEVYNASELRGELEMRGHVFHTRTDTEVVLAAFAQYGPDCVAKLEGMFAFAIWDPRNRILHVARDRLGEKPLFYAELSRNRFLVASEIKALLAAGLDVSLDQHALDYYLQFKHTPPCRSIYAQVRIVPPAHVLSFHADGVKEKRYWSLPPPATARPSREEALDEIARRLSTSVRNRLSGDRPIGIFLSGGVDSTLVGALAADAGARRLFSYTASYRGELDEAPRAEKVACALGLDQTTIIMDRAEPDELEHVCSYYDQPHADSSNLAQALLSRRASHDVPIVLSGDGADELFWGYRWYSPPVSFEERVRQMTILSAEDRRALLPNLTVDPRPKSSADPTEAINNMDIIQYLGGQLLPKADLIGMMHGIELRAPFLDYRVVEYVRALPAELKAGQPGKPLLRELLLRYWPTLLPEPKKQGFGPPIMEWMGQPTFRAYARERLSGTAKIRSFLDPHALDRQVSAAFAEQSRINAYRIWVFLCLELWASSSRIAMTGC